MTGFVEGLGAITGSGNIIIGGTLDMYGDTSYTFDGSMSGGGTFVQFGTNTITLTGTNTYTGQTRVDSVGRIIVNGYQPQSSVVVSTPAGTLAGSGTVGDISCQGHLAPGTSPGILTCSNLFLTGTASFDVELRGPTAGADYDQLNVRGTN